MRYYWLKAIGRIESGTMSESDVCWEKRHYHLRKPSPTKGNVRGATGKGRKRTRIEKVRQEQPGAKWTERRKNGVLKDKYKYSRSTRTVQECVQDDKRSGTRSDTRSKLEKYKEVGDELYIRLARALHRKEVTPEWAIYNPYNASLSKGEVSEDEDIQT